MRGHEWTRREVDFLRANYPAHTAYWCAKQMGRNRSSVEQVVEHLWLKVRTRRAPVVEPEDPDLGPAEPQFAHRCVDCGRVSHTQRCPKCRARYLARYTGECWGPAADEGYEVAI